MLDRFYTLLVTLLLQTACKSSVGELTCTNSELGLVNDSIIDLDCESPDIPPSHTPPCPTPPSHSYTVKIINRTKKAAYSLWKMRINRHFSSVEELQRSLGEHFSDHISDINNLELGYITPGHWARGAQHWIVDKDDIADMYKEYEGRKEVKLRFYCSEKETSKQTKKRSHSSAGSQELSSERRPPNVGSSNYSSKVRPG